MAVLPLLSLALGLVGVGAELEVLMVLTSHDKFGDTGKQTGWFLPEAAHPYFVFEKAGVKMTWASPKGGETPVDETSIKMYAKDKECVEFLKNPKLNTVWKNTIKLDDVDATDFDAIFVVGGFGVLWDLVGNKRFQNIATAIYEQGGVVSGVCHGPTALAGVRLSNGEHLFKGKGVTCFSNAEEDLLKTRKAVPKTCQDAFGEVGAKYKEVKPWGVHTVVDGRLITGQNAYSAVATAKKIVAAITPADDDDDEEEEEKWAVGDVAVTPSRASAWVPASMTLLALVALVAAVSMARRTFGRQSRDLDSEAELGLTAEDDEDRLE